MEYPVTENLVGVELRKSYPGYKSNFGNRSYEIKNKGAKDNQLELLKKFGPAELSHQHPETLEWIVEFEYQTVNNNPTETPICFFSNKEDAIAFVDFHNSTRTGENQMEVEVIRHPHYKSRWAIKSRRHPDQKNPEKWIWFMGGRAYPTKKSAIKSFEYCFQVEIN